MIIEHLKHSDLPQLADLYRVFWNENSSIEKMESTFCRLSENPDYNILVARDNEHIIGSLMGIICHELYGDCDPFMVIEDVVVDPDHRRKGIGSQLMKSIEGIASDAGCSYIIFVTEQTRIEAHRFYASLGYDPDQYKGFKKRL